MTRRQIAVLALLPSLLLLFLAVTTPATASPVADKRAQAQRIMAELQALNAKMEVAVERYNAANENLAAVDAKIRDNERNLVIARYNLGVARETLEQRAEAMYKQRPVDVLDVLLATKSFDDFITQLDLFDRLGRSDVRVMTSIDDYKANIAEWQTSLKADREAAARLVAQRSAEKQSIERSLAQRQSMLKGVKDEIATLERQKAAAGRQQADRQGLLPAPGGNIDPGAGHGNVVAIAMQYIGVPYLYGGSSPQTGFDCSGFTMFCYAQVGVSLPHNAAAQYSVCTPVDRSQMQPGDLVFFGSPIHHVGMFVGGNMMIHSPYTGVSVRVEAIYSDFVGAGRP
jgi:cell wall-associated NlpC family hydrolase